MIAAAAIAAGPDGVPRDRVVEQDLGEHGAAHVAVVFPDPAGPRDSSAAIYLRTPDGWCRVGGGDYVRGSPLNDRGGKHRGLRLIDRHERAVDLYWRDGRIVLTRQGRQLGSIAPSHCAPGDSGPN